MTRDDILEQVGQLTERKAKQVNMKLLYARRLQKICKRYRFWWRKSYAIFTLPVGTTTQDLTKLVAAAPNLLSPATAFTEIGVEEIVTLERVDNASSNPPQTCELSPIFASDGFISMALNQVPSKPGRYLMDYGDYKTLRVDLTDAAYQFVLTFWAMPNPGTDSVLITVPLIPPWYHDAIVDGLVYDVFAASYGESNAKTVKALKDYEQDMIDMIMRPQYSGKIAPQLISTEHAVRSTGQSYTDYGSMNIPPPK